MARRSSGKSSVRARTAPAHVAGDLVSQARQALAHGSWPPTPRARITPGVGLEALATRCRRCDGAIWSDEVVAGWLHACADRAFGHAEAPGAFSLVHPRLRARTATDGLCGECYGEGGQSERAGRRRVAGPLYKGRALDSEAEQIDGVHWRAWISLSLGDSSNVSLNLTACGQNEAEARVRVTQLAMTKVDHLD